jgi:REP-associated tyrosine transposase
MPRRLRVFIPNVSVHVIHRGADRARIFGDDQDRMTFLEIVAAAAPQNGVAVHAYALMTTHYHLLVTPADDTALPRAMKAIDVRYVHYFNGKYDRFGTLWASRYRGILVADDTYALTCLRYIDQNPVRAGIVATPDAYRWSSYGTLTGQCVSDWLIPHPVYIALGRTTESRQAAYRVLCATALADSDLVLHRLEPLQPGLTRV